MSVRDLLIPAKCVSCGKTLLGHESHLCLGCLADMPYTYFWTTPHNKMADAFNMLIEKALPLDAPMREYSRATALFYYIDNYESLTKAVKYGGNAPLGIWLGRQLGKRLLEAGLPQVSSIVPVPLHWKRRRRRGYNQAELIARGVSQIIGAPVRTDLLLRTRSTVTQTALSHDERLANVASAFRVRPQAGLDGHILLIDDVFTTGSTLFACHQALFEAAQAYGTADRLRVSVATIACVP